MSDKDLQKLADRVVREIRTKNANSDPKPKK